MGSRPPVSAIVVSYGTRELTLEAVGSLTRFLPPGSDVWVVDNASTDGSAAAVAQAHPQVNLVELPENVGFGRANNVAMERAQGAHLLLLNSDARLMGPGAVQRMVALMEERPALGVVGPRLEDDSGRLEHSARAFPTLSRELVRRLGLYLLMPRARVGAWLLGDVWAPGEPAAVDWVTGACMLVRREAYEAVGGFDPRIFMYGEEQEWCRRMKNAGWEVLYDPTVTVVHQRAASGPQGEWRIRNALAADVRIFRWAHGRAQALAFNLVRVVGFLLETLGFGAAAAARRSGYMRARRAHAWLQFRQQLRVTLRHPLG